MARQLTERRCVVIIAARDAGELERATTQLGEGTGATVRSAVRDRDAVSALVHEVHQRDGLDLVIANAGVIQVAPVEAVGAAEFGDVMDTMFYGALHTSLEALPYLKGNPGASRPHRVGRRPARRSAPAALLVRKAQGSFGDFLGGVGHSLAAAGEMLAQLGPVCWIEDCSGGTKQYDDFVTSKGLDKNTKAWDAGDATVDILSVFSLATAARSLAKKLLKGGAKSAPKVARAANGRWDLSTGANPMSIIPKNAVREEWADQAGGVAQGAKWRWHDDVTGKTVRMRVHAADPKAPAGSNAAKGDIYRIQIGRQYQDATGKLYHPNVHKEASPHYDPAGTNATHIPWPSQHPRPSYN
ncbi:SDR family NAD(P)-dependent oxidoreductase [Streptomyces anulatus]|uniref:SDR family NAD(P)-dependent oxidoreductase n=1 Tax=Streptomyces anulatus TaxID=1892 RepID=UPI003325F14E